MPFDGIARRTFLESVVVAGVAGLAGSRLGAGSNAAVASGGPEPSPERLILPKFTDRLRIPPVLRPRPGRSTGELTVTMTPAEVRLHSRLPPTRMWTYEGHYPGPTIEVRRGQPVRIAWENQLGGTIPIKAVDYVETAPGRDTDPLTNYPGSAGCAVVPMVADLTPWNVVHLHGMLTGGGDDGWMENVMAPGRTQVVTYPNDLLAPVLWYHDHAHHVTRFNILAGLSGMYVVRSDEEDDLRLPRGDRLIPLILSDRNFELDPAGKLTGQLLHKIEKVSQREVVAPFVGPYNLVNGTIWPYLEVEPGWYRLRLVNMCSSRVYRLVLFDENKQVVPKAFTVVSTDQGFLGAPAAVDGPLILSPAERVDVLVNFAAFAGATLKLINTRPEVDPGAPDTSNNMLEPDVMQFRVSSGRARDDFSPPAALSRSFRRITAADVPADAPQRWIVLTPPGAPKAPEMWEMEEVDPNTVTVPSDGVIQIKTADGTVRTFRRVTGAYADGSAFDIMLDQWEVWRIINLGGPPHPIHLHLTSFQVLARDVYDVSGFSQAARATTKPVAYVGPDRLEPHEQGEKDLIRVAGHRGSNGEMVTIAVRFRHPGRGVYHCHTLEHENHMMRPLIVTPHMTMALGEGHH
ncbi:multicopper oxidase domain-containing protein [Microbispora sp. RL4-1S]|uniref:Multicopper oxidase domain-containing protein n=1 Tax=Microbispora oryzae TaxID=2806554 RepID=A0A941ASG2_9ACTN|nr:multicopper oxidase domain-containing protein [Microbispora oryzae]MBP2708269.1 multicopper oxidase domain-containing protein [Microbispora oryzae]